MSDREPTEPYVYQPEAIDTKSTVPVHEQKLWALSGPGVGEVMRSQRFDKRFAERLLAEIKRLPSLV